MSRLLLPSRYATTTAFFFVHPEQPSVMTSSLCCQGFKEELRQWDTSFWAERLREDKYNITDEELRPYFALPNVLEGLFQV